MKMITRHTSKTCWFVQDTTSPQAQHTLAPLNRSIDELRANARLIAAAPLMYSFVANKADSGDTEAMKIISQIIGGVHAS